MAEPGMRKIIHVDMDAFYASVEQRDDPALKGRPVAVGHAGARGVVAAASYEARAFGVHSAMPSATALRKCPQLIFVSPRFETYRAISREIRAIFAEYTALIEPLSLDEAYLDVTDNRARLATATETARSIRARILGATGLTASAGVSYNKFLAKLASGQRKPNGQFVIPPGAGARFVAALPVAKFHGVGPVTAAKMNRLGIFTGADLASVPLEDLKRHFGKAGPWYYGIARGQDHRPVLADRPRKSSGAERTFGEDLRALAEIDAALARLADEVWAWCEKTGSHGRTVTVKVKYADFRIVTRRQTCAAAIASHSELLRLSLALVRRAELGGMPIRLLGVTLSGFADDSGPARQLDLLPARMSSISGDR